MAAPGGRQNAAMPDRLLSLQALRGAACLLVVGFHLAEWEAQRAAGRAWLAPLRAGYAGVDLFFALSGFVLAWGQYGRPGGAAAAGRFLRRRLWRVLPVYWAVLVVAAVAYKQVLAEPISPPGQAVRWLHWLLLLPSGPPNLYVPTAWSLTFELCFYGLFAAGLCLPGWGRVAGLLLWLGAMAAGTVLGPPADPFLRTLASPYGLEFLAGCLAATLVRRHPTRRGVWLAAAGAVIGLTAAGIPGLGESGPLRAALLGPAAGAVLYGLAAAERAGRAVAPGWLVAAGEASYAIYLAHWPAGMIALFAARRLGTDPADHLLWLLAVGGAMLGAGVVTHLLVERQLLRAKPGGLRRRDGLTGRSASLGGTAARSASR